MANRVFTIALYFLRSNELLGKIRQPWNCAIARFEIVDKHVNCSTFIYNEFHKVFNLILSPPEIYHHHNYTVIETSMVLLLTSSNVSVQWKFPWARTSISFCLMWNLLREFCVMANGLIVTLELFTTESREMRSIPYLLVFNNLLHSLCCTSTQNSPILFLTINCTISLSSMRKRGKCAKKHRYSLLYCCVTWLCRLKSSLHTKSHNNRAHNEWRNEIQLKVKSEDE